MGECGEPYDMDDLGEPFLPVRRILEQKNDIPGGGGVGDCGQNVGWHIECRFSPREGFNRCLPTVRNSDEIPTGSPTLSPSFIVDQVKGADSSSSSRFVVDDMTFSVGIRSITLPTPLAS